MSKTKSNTVTALATVGNNVPSLLELLDKEIQGLQHIADSVYRTTGNLESFGDIKAETKIENLVRAFSSVMQKSKAYSASAIELGVKTAPAFSVSGGNVEDWKQDIQLRIAIITHQDKLNELNAFKKEMASFLSVEDQKTIALAKMAAYFADKK